MPIPKTIAIDGPAASGKSTLGKRLADELDYLFFDTGVMYRAVTWVALDVGIIIKDESAITGIADRTIIDVRPPSEPDGRNCDILADGKDITWQIRKPQVDRNVSQVSAYPGVRQALTTQQRRIGLRGNIVMVGRDIGTVVLPEAEVKIYLDASAEERARRRYEEARSRGEDVLFVDILDTIKKRDQIDSTRQVAPLRPAKDAIVLDSDELNAEQVLELVINILRMSSADT
jgi:cytidylate kinase